MPHARVCRQQKRPKYQGIPVAFIQNGVIYYSPNCSRPVVIPASMNPGNLFRQPCLNAAMFKQPRTFLHCYTMLEVEWSWHGSESNSYQIKYHSDQKAFAAQSSVPKFWRLEILTRQEIYTILFLWNRPDLKALKLKFGQHKYYEPWKESDDCWTLHCSVHKIQGKQRYVETKVLDRVFETILASSTLAVQGDAQCSKCTAGVEFSNPIASSHPDLVYRVSSAPDTRRVEAKHIQMSSVTVWLGS